ncbi:MAG: hypothetical protein WCH20_16180 [Nitrospira sp.]
MCGRFSQTASPEVSAQQFELNNSPLFNPRHDAPQCLEPVSV